MPLRLRGPASLLLVLVFAAALAAQTPIRIAAWNIQATGTAASTQWSRAVAILNRVGPDLCAIEEITDASEVAAFGTFAAATAFPYYAVSSISGTLSGNLYNGILSKHPIVFFDSHSAAEISGDPTANDITRDIFEAHVQVPGAASILGVFVLHLKSGAGGSNEFRRAIEIKRLNQVVLGFQTQNPGAPYVVVGDLNEDVGDGPFGNSFATVPSGMPVTFDLGSDVVFPVVNDPFLQIMSTGTTMLDITQEDSTSLYATRQSSGRRLDYVFASQGIALSGDETYNSVRDNGIDDTPIGNWLTKFGAPLPATWSNEASDHFLIVADASLASVPIDAYPGSGEDFVLSSGVNTAPTTGPGQDVKSAASGDLLFIHFASPSGTFDLEPPLLVAQVFTPGLPPLGPLPGLWVNTSGAVILVNGLDGGPLGFAEVIVPVTGNTHAYQVPPGLSGSSVMFQALAVTSSAVNGFFAITTGHEIQL